MAGVAIVSSRPAEEDIVRGPITADLHMPMAADPATAPDTGLLHAQAYVPATCTPTSDVPRVHDLVVHAPAVDSLVEDDLEAVARAVPDSRV